MTRTRKLSTAIALVAALLVTPALTGCGMLEGIIEQASDGAIDVSMGSLPDDWPAEVPVIDGEIIVGGSANADDGTPGWNVTITVDDATAYDAIKAQLEGAGFTEVELAETDGSADVASGAFSNANYGVYVAVTGTDGKFVANYTVVEGSIAQ